MKRYQVWAIPEIISNHIIIIPGENGIKHASDRS